MALTNDDWNLLARYLAGETSAEEDRRVWRWLRADPSRAHLVRELRQVWDALETPRGVPAVGPLELSAQREKVLRTLALDVRPDERAPEVVPPRGGGQPAPHLTRGPARLGRGHRRAKTGRLLLLAVMLVAVVGAAFIGQQLAGEQAGPGSDLAAPAFREITTRHGQQAQVELTDGTEVKLNAGSTLRVPSTFPQERREVYLEGEAFFDVARRPGRPFTVRTGEGVVQVLGTAFNVTAYPDDGATQVMVARGRVMLRPEDPAREDTVVLQPRELGVVRGGERVRVARGVNPDRYLAWTDGRLVFEHAPFEEVARRLERRYDVQVELAAPPQSLKRLNAAFESESLGEILETIAAALDLRCERAKRQVTFYPAPSGSS